MKKLRTARVIEPNQWLLKTFQKKVLKLQSDFQRYVLNQIMLNLDSEAMLTTDASLSNLRHRQNDSNY